MSHDPRHPGHTYDAGELVRLGDVIDALHLQDGRDPDEHPAALILRLVAGKRPDDGHAIVTQSTARLTLAEYEGSKRLAQLVDADDEFYAVLAMLMRQADTFNAERLRAAFPLVWDDLAARYNARGGVLPDDPTPN